MRDVKLSDLLCKGAGKSALAFITFTGAILSATAVQAEIAISSQPTQNMLCSNGVCAPTAKIAVLNVGDLETGLTSGNVTVTTTGTGVQAGSIHVNSALSWASNSILSLTSHGSITINQPVSITGASGLTIQTEGKNGTVSFGKKGYVTFANLSSQLTINGGAYTLVGDLKTLASDIASNPSGSYALANQYDAGVGGSYSVGTTFTGTFEGLGNTISNFALIGAQAGYLGLFSQVGGNGMLRDVELINASVNDSAKAFGVGSLAGENSGTIAFCYATGTVTGLKQTSVGGLVGENTWIIANSHASVTVSANQSVAGGLVGSNPGTIRTSYATGAIAGRYVGGLVAANTGTIVDSFATGDVQAKGIVSEGGGLVGDNYGGSIANSYATGSVRGGSSSFIYLGGLVGFNADLISNSYATGSVAGGAGSVVGGLIGVDEAPSGSLADTYWDTDTSGITNPSQGAGNIANDPGITGLSTTQLQSGLPTGFDPKIWGEQSNIDDGFPYLIANPPPKKQ